MMVERFISAIFVFIYYLIHFLIIMKKHLFLAAFSLLHLFLNAQNLCPDNNHPHAIDLGIGVKFACCNVGASSPWKYGDYFAWGEKNRKTNYTQYNYESTSYDVANVKWGSKWRMPSVDDMKKLVDECGSYWTKIEGVSGILVAGPNGNSIFLPAAGYRWYDNWGAGTYDDGRCGGYWSYSLYPNRSGYAYGLFFNSDKFDWNCFIYRAHGLPVRPVESNADNWPSPTSNHPATTPQSSSPVPTSNRTFTAKGVSFTMVYVQGGTFTMGATSEQGSDAGSDEKPTHRVTLSSYMIGQTEVTQALWQAVMGNNPSYFKGDSRRPVECVSWDDCQTFLRKLNSLTGQRFRLPTEAEWEFAARGGTKSLGYKYSGSNNIGDVAWYDDNSGSTTHPVGTKQPNELGIYDMSGNVWEWCNDWYGGNYYSSSPSNNPQGPSSGSDRVLRGGSWGLSTRSCRVSDKDCRIPDFRNYGRGLRLGL